MVDTIGLRNLDRDCGSEPTHHKGGHAGRLRISGLPVSRTACSADPDRFPEFQNRAESVQPVAGAEAREPKPGPDRSAVRFRA